jgi:O-antigen ligase
MNGSLVEKHPARRVVSQAAFAFLWAFVFTVPWENMSMIPGLGTMGRTVGLVAFVFGVLAVADGDKLRTMTTPQVLIIVFGCWRALTYLWSINPDETLREIVTTLQLIAMIWLLNQYTTDWNRQLRILQAYVLGTVVSAIGTIYSYASGTFADGQYLRYAPSGFNPGDLALVFVLSIPMSLYLMTQARGAVSPWIYRLQLILASIAILLTAARGGLVAGLPALMMLPAVVGRMKSRQVLALTVAAVIGTAAILSVVPDTSWDRLGSIVDEVRYGTLNDRVGIWKAGIELFRTRPFVGVGAGAYLTGVESLLGVGWVAHNTFLSILVEEGAMGFALFGLILCSLFGRILKSQGLERKLWFVLLLTWAVGVMDLSWDSRKTTWLLFGIISLQPIVQKKAVRRDRGRTAVEAGR